MVNALFVSIYFAFLPIMCPYLMACVTKLLVPQWLEAVDCKNLSFVEGLSSVMWPFNGYPCVSVRFLFSSSLTLLPRVSLLFLSQFNLLFNSYVFKRCVCVLRSSKHLLFLPLRLREATHCPPRRRPFAYYHSMRGECVTI